MIRKTALIAVPSHPSQNCIYYKCFIIDTALENGTYYVEDDILVIIVNQQADWNALRQLKTLQKEQGNNQLIYPSETNLIEHRCKELLADFDSTIARMKGC